MTSYFLGFAKSYFRSYFGLSKLCWQGISLNFVESILGGVFYFLSLYFVEILHFNIALTGTIISFYGIGAILGGFIGGKLSDRISPNTISIFSLLTEAVGYAALIKLKTVNLLMFDVFILGIATYSFLTSNYVWILGQCRGHEVEKLKAINILSAGSNLGLGLSALIISAFAHYGFHYIFLTSSILLFFSACYLIFQERKKVILVEINEIKIKEVGISKESDRVTWLILLCVFFVGAIVVQMSSTYPVYVEAAFPTLGIKAVSILFAINSFLIVFFQMPIINLFNNDNKVLMVGVGAFLIGFGMLALSFSFTFILAIVSCVIYTIGEMLFFSMAQLVCYQKGEKKKKGHSLGIYRMVYATSRVAGPVMGGFIYYHFGGNMVLYLSGLIGILCLISCNYYKQYD